MFYFTAQQFEHTQAAREDHNAVTRILVDAITEPEPDTEASEDTDDAADPAE
jgi:hypothetical protein